MRLIVRDNDAIIDRIAVTDDEMSADDVLRKHGYDLGSVDYTIE